MRPVTPVLLVVGLAAAGYWVGNQARQFQSNAATSPDPAIAATGDIDCDPNSPNFEGGQGTFTACHIYRHG